MTNLRNKALVRTRIEPLVLREFTHEPRTRPVDTESAGIVVRDCASTKGKVIAFAGLHLSMSSKKDRELALRVAEAILKELG